MAKAKKTIEPVIKEQIDDNIPSLHETTNDSEPIIVDESESKTEEEDVSVYVPDIPAQAVEVKKEKPDTDEILFLKRILQIQEEGGFGKHLHDIINERIKSLK